MDKIPMTLTGVQKLKEEVEHLEKVVRPQVIKDISEARAHGDLSENAEYHAAKEKQGLVERRINSIRKKLRFAQIIDITKLPKRDRVVFGCTVTLCNVDTQETFTYKIVGVDEADAKSGSISFSSPVAKAIISKKVSDCVEVKTLSGLVNYMILKIDYV